MHTHFDNIKKQMQQLSFIKKSVVGKLEQLKHIYNDMVKHNNNKKIFLICLESFHFQYKVFNVELHNMERLYLLLTNRTYYDYSCTYNLLHKLYVDYGIQVPTQVMHRPYKDLDPFAEYELDDIYLVQSNAVELLNGLVARHAENEIAIAIYKSKMLSGIHITSFIHTLEYDNNVLKDQICLYESYFAFYYDTQLKYFTELLSKMKSFCAHIDAEIKLPPNQTVIDEDDTVAQMSDDACIVQVDEPISDPVPLPSESVPLPSESVPLKPEVNIVLEIKKEDTFSETSSDTSIKKPRKKRTKATEKE